LCNHATTSCSDATTLYCYATSSSSCATAAEHGFRKRHHVYEVHNYEEHNYAEHNFYGEHDCHAKHNFHEEHNSM
jgi:ribonucleotide reductase alpha subunit